MLTITKDKLSGKRCGVRDDSMQLLFSGGNIVFCKSECICNINKWFEKESSSCEK